MGVGVSQSLAGGRVGSADNMAGFKGVTRCLRHGQHVRWLAQSKPHGLWKHGFQTRLAAAEWLAKQLRVSVSHLARGAKGRLGCPSPHLAVSAFHGVIARQRAGHAPYFEARVVGSCHATALAAARVVAKKHRTTIKKLMKKEPLTPRIARQVFKASYHVFRSYVPGDLENLCSTEQANRPIYVKEPVWGVV